MFFTVPAHLKHYLPFSHKMKSFIAMLLIQAFVGTLALGQSPQLDPAVTETLKEKGFVNVIVSFQNGQDSSQTVLDNHKTQKFASRQEKISALVQGLKVNSEVTQSQILNQLHTSPGTQNKDIKQLWITNEISIREADQATVDLLLGMENVQEIRKEAVHYIGTPVQADVESKSDIHWGVDAVNAGKVWEKGVKGQGAIVANIDTGVLGDHEALRDGFLDWKDASLSGRTEPIDKQGHGTHCMGTMVGRTSKIGVAPEAKWIACKACDDVGICFESYIKNCGEWVLCPDHPECSKSAHVVSNSYGGPFEHSSYDHMISVWVAADITPVYSAGNSGPNCGTLSFPGSHPDVLGVGSIDQGFFIADHSSRGPPTSSEKRIQPDVAAPGVNIYSAGIEDSQSYSRKSGTSMAAPHVAGIAALLYSVDPNLSVAQIRKYITKGAVSVQVSGTETCGETKNTEYPNNFVGHGRVDALRAYEAQQNSAEILVMVVQGKSFVLFSAIVFCATKILDF